MIIHAPAKVNLFLELHGRRTTGFHDLETIMAPVSWYDTLRFSPSEGEAIKLRVHQPIAKLRHEVIPTDGSNLVVKAVEALRLHLGVEHGLSIDLVKRIPSQAGLGGGSSDAAAALLGAARCWGVEVSQAALMEIAGELGSDIPFFLGDGWSRCVGRGERIEALGIKQCLWVVIAKPPVGLATGQVFAGAEIPAEPASSAQLVRAAQRMDLETLGTAMLNRLSEPARRLTDWIDRLKLAFECTGSCGAMLSGSGSACFGIYPSRIMAMRAARQIRCEQQLVVGVARTLASRIRWGP